MKEILLFYRFCRRPALSGESGVRYARILLFLLLIPVFMVNAEEMSERLRGRILLQVESHGEAWYVNPDSQKRFYLGRPADAFRVMREQGIGISNKDFDAFAGIAPKRLAGKILLKVEENGEAYYVNPDDLKMHYLGRPADAFRIMRSLGLGITDSDLELIEVDEKSSPVTAEEEITSETEERVAEEENKIATTTEETIKDVEEVATTTEEIIIKEDEATATSTCVWLAEYYDNKKLIGNPVATSTVETIDFDWGINGPEEINRTNSFSIRFTAHCYFEEGAYEFQTVFDDAIKVYLDNTNFLQSWTDNNKTRIINRERNVSEGEHEVKVEYYEKSGKAKVSVGWVKVGNN
jgi:hypothetical protein